MRKLILTMGLFSLLSCFNRHEKKDQYSKDAFYTSKGSYDAVRIPLIKPYELMKLNGDSTWVMNLIETPGSVSHIRGVSVRGNFIFLKAGESYCNNESVKASWTIIDVLQRTEKCFKDQESFAEASKVQITFRDPNVVYKEFNDKGRLYW